MQPTRREFLQGTLSLAIASKIDKSTPFRQIVPAASSNAATGAGYGSGNFGRWIEDEFGLPAFRYSLNQTTDPRAVTDVRPGVLASREHIHQVGNDRITALASGVPGLKCANGDRAEFPLYDLMAMPLQSMLSVLRSLGKYRLIADKTLDGADELAIITGAAAVLNRWPTGFMSLLEDLGKASPSQAGGVANQFHGIYGALFKNEITRGHTAFLKTAFLDFAQNHWSKGVVDHKLTNGDDLQSSHRFMTRSEFAARLGIQPRTAARMLVECPIFCAVG